MRRCVIAASIAKRNYGSRVLTTGGFYLYGVDEEHTSDDARELMRIALETSDRDELLAKLLDWYEDRGVLDRRSDDQAMRANEAADD